MSSTDYDSEKIRGRAVEWVDALVRSGCTISQLAEAIDTVTEFYVDAARRGGFADSADFADA